MTPVIFRKWSESEGGGIIALFPTDLGTNDPYTSSSYARVGQHGSANPVGVIEITTAATPSEYAALLEELKNLGYDDLKVYQRLQSSFLEERRRKLAEFYQPLKSKPVKQKSKRKPKTRSSQTGLMGMR